MSHAFLLQQQVRPRRAGSQQRRRHLAPMDRGDPFIVPSNRDQADGIVALLLQIVQR